MLNRRMLRIKAFKVLYGYAVRGGMTIDEATRELDLSCEATRDLYLFMLGLVEPLTREAARRAEAAKLKFSASDEELHPNEKFANNSLASFLASDRDLQKLLAKKKLDWSQYDVFMRELMDSISAKDYYNNYMDGESSSLAEDCELFMKIYEEELVDNTRLEGILEDMNLYWIDDLAYALSWDCRSLQDIARGKQWRLPELYNSDYVMKRNPGKKLDSDSDFVHKLLRVALSGYEKYFEMASSLVPDWDSDRLLSADMAIIALCMAEVEAFPEIHPNISMNEYIEITKYYSSLKSRQFVNGVLDRLIRERNSSGE